MSKIPCKKCKSCGFYHDLSNMTCNECGADLRDIPALLIEIETIPGEIYGEIEPEVPVFVQKCSACGTLNFTADKEARVEICYNCHKKRVASVDPVEYIETQDLICLEEESIVDITIQDDTNTGKEKMVFDDDDDDDDDDESAPWQGILGNIRKSVRGSEPKLARKVEIVPETQNSIVEPDDDDENVSDWSGLLGGQPMQKNAVFEERKPSITLTAVRYGCLSFTIEAKDNKEYMLGRSAKQREFLCNDRRVSNEHCYLYFRKGTWYVKDNHSSNGTAVNSKDLGLNGESRLNDGDELKLGHHSDSMAFRITIR